MAGKGIKLGVIGMSEGNGHPYSWSAIFNGYDPEEMKNCGFPVIPTYLAEQKWPEAQIAEAKVTHIWTQEKELSNHIAKSALIPNVVENIEELIHKVDAVLLARDDAENHFKMALPFLEAGIPIYVDKPLSLNIVEAQQMLQAQHYEGQLFTCSALRYASELYLSEAEIKKLGGVEFIQAQIPKSWEKYAIHILEPIIAGNPGRGSLKDIKVIKSKGVVKAHIIWEHLEADLTTYGKYLVPLQISYFGSKNFIVKDFKDTFSAFKSSLVDFLISIKQKKVTIPREETLEAIQIIEKVINA